MTIPKEDLDKRIVFTDTTKRQADFRIRLGYDGMTQSEFFRAMISGYLEQDRDLLDYLEKYKREKKGKRDKARIPSRRIATFMKRVNRPEGSSLWTMMLLKVYLT